MRDGIKKATAAATDMVFFPFTSAALQTKPWLEIKITPKNY